MKIAFTPKFLRLLKRLPRDLQEDVITKIKLLSDTNNHHSLKVHKLKGRLKGFYSFSVDYKNRVIFEYISDDEIVLLAVGDHDMYRL